MLRNKIETKMAEYEILLSDLETQKAQLELERGYRITKKDLLAFIEELLKGDVNDKEYQKQIINHLVSQVFVSDDDTVDACFDQVKSALITRIAADPTDGEYAVDLLMIAKYFERIGDHAVNVAQWVIFSVTGTHKEG